ncbi:MAG TPA: HEAT repeat domain-containing protein [Terriglobales bacterium]|nr:HEAT repeat domain-containing protein [Terriglobales bacterium]
MKTRLFLMLLLCGAAAVAAVQAPQMQNAKLVNRETADLRGEVGRIVAANQPAWIAYAAPMIAGEHDMCCYSDYGAGRSCGCALEGGNVSITASETGNPTQHLENTGYFYVFLRSEGGKAEKVRAFSAGCPIDADGMTVYWLGSPKPADSVALLASLISSSDSEDRHDRIAGQAVMAIAFTNDPAADQEMDKLLAASQPRSVRKKAAFWTAQMRGKPGLDKLAALLRNDADDDFRRDLTFDLTQSKLPQAEDELIRAAHQDPSSRVRSQALFWLAQRAGKKVAGTITDAIERDPDTDVKKKAVFALTQMPDGEGVPLLIQVARNNTNPVVRKQAVFWLGQSHDPRALDFIESVLKQ